MSNFPIPDALLEQLETVAQRENLTLVSLIRTMLAQYHPSSRPHLPPGELTIEDLGWTPDQAAAIRAQLSAFAEDWDDPAMDVYDEI
ncbi:MAG: hypothetical protein BroJett018_27190 [Chloroflexota bacterium]|nr:MAG: hypothetical protein BroJett018_27190 [Chloroflexota bacterium]